MKLSIGLHRHGFPTNGLGSRPCVRHTHRARSRGDQVKRRTQKDIIRNSKSLHWNAQRRSRTYGCTEAHFGSSRLFPSMSCRAQERRQTHPRERLLEAPARAHFQVYTIQRVPGLSTWGWRTICSSASPRTLSLRMRSSRNSDWARWRLNRVMRAMWCFWRFASPCGWGHGHTPNASSTHNHRAVV